jgi:hypothetical protein
MCESVIYVTLFQCRCKGDFFICFWQGLAVRSSFRHVWAIDRRTFVCINTSRRTKSDEEVAAGCIAWNVSITHGLASVKPVTRASRVLGLDARTILNVVLVSNRLKLVQSMESRFRELAQKWPFSEVVELYAFSMRSPQFSLRVCLQDFITADERWKGFGSKWCWA